MKINSKVVSDRFEDEVVVVSLESGIYYSLKGSAIEIWKLLESSASANAISESFNLTNPDQQNEINFFLEFLAKENLISNEIENEIDVQEPINFAKIEYSKYDDMADMIMLDPIHEVDDKKGWPNKPA